MTDFPKFVSITLEPHPIETLPEHKLALLWSENDDKDFPQYESVDKRMHWHYGSFRWSERIEETIGSDKYNLRGNREVITEYKSIRERKWDDPNWRHDAFTHWFDLPWSIVEQPAPYVFKVGDLVSYGCRNYSTYREGIIAMIRNDSACIQYNSNSQGHSNLLNALGSSLLKDLRLILSASAA